MHPTSKIDSLLGLSDRDFLSKDETTEHTADVNIGLNVRFALQDVRIEKSASDHPRDLLTDAQVA
jgi:hypothetical protein